MAIRVCLVVCAQRTLRFVILGLVVISPLTQLILRQVADFNSKITSCTTTCPWLNAVSAYTPDGTVADAKSDTARRIYSGKANVVFLYQDL